MSGQKTYVSAHKDYFHGILNSFTIKSGNIV
jgi:hypothetical protein